MPRADIPPDLVALKALLAKTTEQAAEAAVSGSVPVPADRLEELSRLARLIGLREAAVAVPTRRWPMALLAFATLAIVSLLLFIRLSTTEVELDLRVSQVSFVAAETEALTEAMNVTAFGASGLRWVRLPSTQPGPGLGQPAAALAIFQERAVGKLGGVSVDPLVVPAGARVSVEEVARGRQYRLGLGGIADELGASVLGPIRIVVPPGVNTVEHFPVPRPIVLRPDSVLVQFDLTLADTSGTEQLFRSPLPVNHLVLIRTDQFHQGDRTLPFQVPTILSGTLFFEEIDGHARELRAGEGLHLSTSFGELRELRPGPEGIVVRFHGKVSDMTVGSGDSRRSLMPTVFEWLAARHGLSLLWGTTVYLVGLLVTLLGWWRRRPQ
jgi:hypothetical protein